VVLSERIAIFKVICHLASANQEFRIFIKARQGRTVSLANEVY